MDFIIAPISCPTCNCCSTPPSSDDMRRSSMSASTQTRTPTAQPTSLTSPFASPPASPLTLATDVGSYFPKSSGSGSGASTTTTAESNSHAYRRAAVPDAVDDEYCQNCSFLVPKEVSSRIPRGAPGSPSKDGKGRNGSPVLRTSQSITAYGSPMHHHSSAASSSASRIGNRFSSSKTDTASYSSSSSSSVSENNDLAHSSPSSSLYMSPPSHTHRLTYISTRYPTSPSAYSNLRRSCIRTLSTENLPRGSGCGSLFFGDPIAGYSVTHVFRLPDPLARGRLRTYALIALGSRDNWKVSQVILEITRTFERLASRIVAMANRVLDDEAAVAAAAATATTNDPGRTAASTSAPTRPIMRNYDAGRAMAGSGARKLSAPPTPMASATSTLTLRGKGDGDFVAGKEPSAARSDMNQSDVGLEPDDSAGEGTTAATTSSLASTVTAVDGLHASISSSSIDTTTTTDTSDTTNTSILTPTPTLTCSTPTPVSTPKPGEQEEEEENKNERETTTLADKTRLPQTQQSKQSEQQEQEDGRQHHQHSDPSKVQSQASCPVDERMKVQPFTSASVPTAPAPASVSASAALQPAPSRPSQAPAPPAPPPLRSITPLSSFLAAKKVDPDGYPRDSHSATSMLEEAKKRGLAEIVGQEDFFVELHASFVVILARLVGEFGVR